MYNNNTLYNRGTVINDLKKNLKYLVTACPNEIGKDKYINTLICNNVGYLVKLCEDKEIDNYPFDSALYDQYNIEFHNLSFEDGCCPSEEIIEKWYQICMDAEKKNKCIAVHCKSGLGRAPSLVALSMIKNGVDNIQAIEHIRKNIKGSFNSIQLAYIMQFSNKGNIRNCGCSIM